MTARHLQILHVPHIVIDPCIVFKTTHVSVKPARLLQFLVIWLPPWISSTHRASHEIGCTTTIKADPENIVVVVEILITLVIDSEIFLLPVVVAVGMLMICIILRKYYYFRLVGHHLRF